MPAQQIIRHESHMDRGAKVSISTERVLQSVRSLPIDEWTTFDVAMAMGVSEYPVRAAISWLLVRKVLEVSGTRKGFYWTGRKRKTYVSNTYRLKGVAEVDFHTLNMAFVYGR